MQRLHFDELVNLLLQELTVDCHFRLNHPWFGQSQLYRQYSPDYCKAFNCYCYYYYDDDFEGDDHTTTTTTITKLQDDGHTTTTTTITNLLKFEGSVTYTQVSFRHFLADVISGSNPE